MKKKVLVVLLLTTLSTSCFSCSCTDSIELANNQIPNDVEDFLSGVNDSIDSLSDQLDSTLKELKNRTDNASSSYENKLKSLLQPFTDKNIENRSIEGQLMNVKLYPPTSESKMLSKFLFEYKKLTETKYYK